MIRIRFAGAAALATLMAPAVAFASGEIGEHVENFAKHLDTYESGVEKLEKRLAAVAEDGTVTSKEVDAFIAAWEDVKVHAAIEAKATPMYPAIWQGIYALRDTAKTGGSDAAAVNRRTEAVADALHQGLGALKYRARAGDQTEVAEEGHEAGEDGIAATFRRIDKGLDEAVAEYAEGDPEAAKELIRTAYLDNFETVEGGLIEKDADLVTDLEEAFNAALPGLLNGGADVADVRARVDEMKTALDRAQKLLAEDTDDNEVF